MDFGVYSISKHVEALGQSSKTKTRILAGEVLLHYSVPSPTVYDPSAFKVFSLDRTLITAVRTYTDPSSRFDVHAIDWSEDIKQTSTTAIKRITVT